VRTVDRVALFSVIDHPALLGGPAFLGIVILSGQLTAHAALLELIIDSRVQAEAETAGAELHGHISYSHSKTTSV
jgi:hypothetical protein